MSAPLHPNVSVQLSGQDSNAFVIIARIGAALRRAGVPKAEIDQFRAEAMGGDYDNVLQTAMRWVDVS